MSLFIFCASHGLFLLSSLLLAFMNCYKKSLTVMFLLLIKLLRAGSSAGHIGHDTYQNNVMNETLIYFVFFQDKILFEN